MAASSETGRLPHRASFGGISTVEEDGGDAEAWIAWVEQYRVTIDPTAARIVMPETPEPRSDDLAAYLPHGMNPYGPNRW